MSPAAIRIAALLVVGAGTLAGCSTVSNVVSDSWPRMLGGLPEGVPPRLETPPAYLPVHDVPPPRETKRMTPQEKAKVEAEMAVSRTQNATQAEETKKQSPDNLPSIR
jgi:hypothetical protein